jgi:hypothetical protein
MAIVNRCAVSSAAQNKGKVTGWQPKIYNLLDSPFDRGWMMQPTLSRLVVL